MAYKDKYGANITEEVNRFQSGIWSTELGRFINESEFSTLTRRPEVIDRSLKSDTPISHAETSNHTANISEIITQNADKLAGIEEGAIIPN